MKNIVIVILTWLLVLPVLRLAAQEKNGKLEINEMITEKKFIFLAETAVPTNFQTRQLSFGYDVQVAPDSIISHLPYFGRAYIAPMDPAKGGIQFISTDFTYHVEEKNNGGFIVTILPKDNSDIQQIFLHVTESGYANLQIVSTFRQPITFYGRVKERKHLRAF